MAASLESKIPPEAILNLKDRLKHGQNVTKILESQLDTAQQNISLLQGQVRLANETILNLKKHFHETEKILSQLMCPEPKSKFSLLDSESRVGDLDTSPVHASVDSTTRSPLLLEPVFDTHKSFEEKNDKSPYAVQLRQVLDVLDEEPRKPVAHHDVQSTKDCNCSDCLTPRKRFEDCDCGSSSCSSDHRKSDEYCKTKHKTNGHPHHDDVKMYNRNEPAHMGHSMNYSSHCSGPCCSNSDNYKLVDKSPGQMHYISMHSPGRLSEKHHEHRHHGHCSDKCHSYVNYVPYGYHVVEGAPPGMPESIQPLSPSRRKRPYISVMPTEEPPHLKYTKVKRIDGSKLTAQKVLQDFTKRRFTPYNPRYDLDLLIVPPPIPAVDLLKKKDKIKHPLENYSVSSSSALSGPRNKNPLLQHEDDDLVKQQNGAQSNLNCSNNSNNNNHNNNNNNNNNNDNNISNNYSNDVNHNNESYHVKENNNTIFTESPSYKSLNALPPIKEERHEARSKLEDHINKLRNDSRNAGKESMKSHYYEPDHNTSSGMKTDGTASPIAVGSSRTI